jgi:hypothetical protein
MKAFIYVDFCMLLVEVNCGGEQSVVWKQFESGLLKLIALSFCELPLVYRKLTI